MAKFSVTVTRTDEYEIVVDENVWTKEEIKEWAKGLSVKPISEDENYEVEVSRV